MDSQGERELCCVSISADRIRFILRAALALLIFSCTQEPPCGEEAACSEPQVAWEVGEPARDDRAAASPRLALSCVGATIWYQRFDLNKVCPISIANDGWSSMPIQDDFVPPLGALNLQVDGHLIEKMDALMGLEGLAHVVWLAPGKTYDGRFPVYFAANLMSPGTHIVRLSYEPYKIETRYCKQCTEFPKGLQFLSNSVIIEVLVGPEEPPAHTPSLRTNSRRSKTSVISPDRRSTEVRH